MNIEPLPPGTPTCWRHLERPEGDSPNEILYICEAPFEGPEFLAEQLRQDGAAPSLGAALSMSEHAAIRIGWIYIDDYTDDEYILNERDDSLGPPVQVVTAKVCINE